MRSEIRTVLVVDDDYRVAAAFKRGLEVGGMAVLTAGTRHEALSLARSRSPDACIVDYQLPDGESGLDLVRALRADYPATMIVVVSGYATMELGAQAIKVGADYALAKPVRIGEIMRRLSGCMIGFDRERNSRTDEHVRWEHMRRVLDDCGGNRSEAARRLGIDRTTLLRWLSRFSP